MAAIVLLALSALLQFTAVSETRHDGVIHGDATKYIFYAYNLKYHGTFSRVQSFGPGHEAATVVPDKLTLPGYPYFLSLFVDGIPDRSLVRRATYAQAALGVASTFLAFLVALRVLPLGWAFCAGVLIATLPHLITINTYLVTEGLFTFLLLASVLAALFAARPDSGKRHYIVTGILVGLACLVRPQLQLLPLVAIVVVLMVRGLRPYLAKVLIAAVCFFAVVAPWQWRNTGVERNDNREPDLLVNTLYHGSFPNMMYRDDPRTFGYPYQYDPDQARITRDLPSVIEHIHTLFATEPLRYVRWYLLGKPGYFLSGGNIAGADDIFLYQVADSPYFRRWVFAATWSASVALHLPLMLLALLATFLALWKPRLLAAEPARQQGSVILAVLLAYVIVLHAIGAPFPRYNIPFRPLEFILTLVALRAIWIRARASLGGNPPSHVTDPTETR